MASLFRANRIRSGRSTRLLLKVLLAACRSNIAFYSLQVAFFPARFAENVLLRTGRLGESRQAEQGFFKPVDVQEANLD